MAITFAVLSVSQNRIKLLATQDGGAGTTASIANAVIVHATTGLGSVQDGALLALWTATYASQALARAALSEGAQASVRITPRTGAAPTWACDVNVSATLPIVDVISQAGAGDAIVEIFFNHSIVR